MSRFYRATFLVAVLSVSTISNAALVSRADGTMVYDTDLDITWLADANYSMSSGYDADGKMTWDETQTWIDTLNTESHLGFNDWRLPTTLVPDSSCSNTNIDGLPAGTNCTGSEMGHLFYNELGGAALNSILDSADPDLALFFNIQSDVYWADDNDSPFSGSAWTWIFLFSHGAQDLELKGPDYYTWAVRDGDIGAVPVPAAVWLFCSGLIGLIGMAKRKRTTS